MTEVIKTASHKSTYTSHDALNEKIEAMGNVVTGVILSEIASQWLTIKVNGTCDFTECANIYFALKLLSLWLHPTPKWPTENFNTRIQQIMLQWRLYTALGGTIIMPNWF